MSKSNTSYYDKINLSDSQEDIEKKVKKAVTDNTPIVNNDKQRVNLQNLMSIYSGFSDKTIEEVEREFENQSI